ncbi:hypothetical protein [Cellulosimicrobium cellulans]|uniref:hypothetical protein n=1 Tax=Cellulosimicrobium cellulans TaxID=1710 RepID=UPI001BA8E396|nr:hypothetical protein [Cellulosimicrobium cellulans]QUC01112.1 hypothetical protein J5A69_08060 [Cellulosimicrobium cellulans]
MDDTILFCEDCRHEHGRYCDDGSTMPCTCGFDRPGSGNPMGTPGRLVEEVAR